MAAIKPDKVLDVKGLLCPLPVIKAKQVIQEIALGGILEILATDPAADSDITAWTKRAGHELLNMDKQGEVLIFHVKRRR